MKFCDSYWITQALAVENFYDGIHQSKIYTMEGIKLSTMTQHDLLDKACLRYAATLEGRRMAAKKLLDFPNKTPIVIAPYTIGAFPTSSHKNSNCVWIFNHPFQVEQLEDATSLVKFTQGTTITVNASKRTLLHQKQKLHSLLDICSNEERRMHLYLSKGFKVNESQGMKEDN